ncbi:hypothetical protein RHMOL_Rhmol12G0240100 [Rhododendron molle]|uniref:Uncharacterized protein n=1 Tax=Rhododendron molle TaxID=49168 RepID=A0ACC0LLX5_RHOML|nr:hypothetical protein RHMOL_Rhmol12G0240100 [Rhododendron molle]
MGVLKQLNLQNYSNISKRVLEAREELVCVQARLFTSPVDEDLCTQEKLLVQKYIELRNAEESFIKQRSRVKWLALGDWGDHNTKYFHQKLCTHRDRNTIDNLFIYLDSVLSVCMAIDVFEDASPLVTSVLDGYNVCIFAYGYGEDFYNGRLEIKQASQGDHHVPGIVESRVGNIKEVWDVLRVGSSARAVGSNNVSEQDSMYFPLCLFSFKLSKKFQKFWS